MSLKPGWIGVDLDGTLAVYDPAADPDSIGDPIPEMVDRVKRWVAEGNKVKIFTARVYGIYTDTPDLIEEGIKAQRMVRAWAAKHGLPRSIEVTALKDYEMTELWDDSAVQVIRNRGIPVAAPTKTT
jgi:hypothetical protein